MTENRCIYCCGPAPKTRALCPDCRERMKDEPIEIETVLWRPFPLIKPRITSKEFLVTSKDGDVNISLWDGYDWVSTEDYFIKTDSVIAWTNVPSPYKPREEKTDD